MESHSNTAIDLWGSKAFPKKKTQNMEHTVLSTTTIGTYSFNEDGAKALLSTNKGADWPVVYILDGKDGQKPVA